MPGRTFTIGDVHGCARELETLLGGLPLARGDAVVCVGDYVDRGPDSRAVLDLLLALRDRDDVETVFLRGNHEEMALAYLGRGGRYGEAWGLNGGAATLRSYGLDARTPGREVARALPPAHLAFLESLVLSHRAAGHLVVHAGIRPDRALAEQDEEDLLWIREEFVMRPHALPDTVVFGHTPHRDVLVDLPYKIGIDTGCVYGGALTALELGERRLFQVRAGERRVRTAPLPAPRRAARPG
ncbi:MAG TPA: metallophosphoesterase family protein [Candidatus Binatia bacterium]|nr:metallophosphoesterase family protein [Candidatus Binatia bacterium]